MKNLKCRSDPKTGKINHPKVTTLWRCWKKRTLMDVAFFNCTHLWWACHLGNQQSAWPPNTHTSDHHHTAQICQPTRPHKHILVLRSWRGPFSVCVQTALNPNIMLNHNSNHHILSLRYVFTRCSIVFPLWDCARVLGITIQGKFEDGNDPLHKCWVLM